MSIEEASFVLSVIEYTPQRRSNLELDMFTIYRNSWYIGRFHSKLHIPWVSLSAIRRVIVVVVK